MQATENDGARCWDCDQPIVGADDNALLCINCSGHNRIRELEEKSERTLIENIIKVMREHL